MSRRRQRRARLVWLTLFALLLQQFALAAHACDMAFAPLIASTDATTTGAHCERDADSHDKAAADPVCAKHCLPDRATSADTASAKLPPMLLPADSFRVAHAASTRVASAWPTAATSARPPPPLRFRVLLI